MLGGSHLSLKNSQNYCKNFVLMRENEKKNFKTVKNKKKINPIILNVK